MVRVPWLCPSTPVGHCVLLVGELDPRQCCCHGKVSGALQHHVQPPATSSPSPCLAWSRVPISSMGEAWEWDQSRSPGGTVSWVS